MARGYFPRQRSSFPGSESTSSEANNNTSSESSNMRFGGAGLHFPLQTWAVPIYTTPPSREDVEVGGRVLLQNYISHQFQEHGLPEDAIEVDEPPPDAFGDAGEDVVEERAASPALSRPLEGFSNTQQFVAIGAIVRDIAEEFAQSHHRQQIRETADQVDLNQINHSTFIHLMEEVFRNGIDRFNIIALFTLCSDILIRCVKAELFRLGSKLFFWAVEFLCRRICDWVYEHGGWENVLTKVYNVGMKITAWVALGVFITCGIIYIKSKR